MRILSDFKDYYDGVAAYDEERESFFLRKRKEQVSLPYGQLEKLEPIPASGPRSYSYSHGNEYVSFVIGFAGVLYPGIHWHYKERRIFIYDADTAVSYFKYDAADFFEQFPFSSPALFEKFGGQFILSWGYNASLLPGFYGQDGHLHVLENAALGPMLFGKVLNPMDAYRQLQMWVWAQNRPARPVPEMSDEIKIHQKGFNKSSFRADPGTRPKRKRK